MTLNKFWEFLLAVESEYSVYRKKITKRFELTAAEADILMFLANNPGFDTAAQISQIRKIPKSQVSVSVNALCEKKLLTREYINGNKKSVHLKPTLNAAQIIKCGKDVQNDFQNLLFENFTAAEKAEFARLHEKMASNIENKKEVIK